MLLTPWRYSTPIDPAALIKLVNLPNIIDGQNALDPYAWTGAGWNYYGMGRAVPTW